MPKKNKTQEKGGPDKKIEKTLLDLIPIDQIEVSEEFTFRESISQETVDRYADLLQEYMDNIAQYENSGEGEEPKYPFPSISVWKTEECRYIVVAGAHRLKAAVKVGQAEIHCIVHMNREAAIWAGLQDNRWHGLPLNKGDLRKCIEIALKEFDGQKSKREIANLLGCSHTYVNKVCEKVETSFHSSTGEMDANVENKQRRHTANAKKKPKQNTMPGLPCSSDSSGSIPKSKVDVSETPMDSVGDQPFSKTEIIEENTDRQENESGATSDQDDSKGEIKNEEGISAPKPSSSVHGDTERVELSTPIASGAICVEGLPKKMEADFCQKFRAWLDDLQISDRERVKLYQSLMIALFSSIADDGCRRDFFTWLDGKVKEHLKLR